MKPFLILMFLLLFVPNAFSDETKTILPEDLLAYDPHEDKEPKPKNEKAAPMDFFHFSAGGGYALSQGDSGGQINYDTYIRILRAYGKSSFGSRSFGEINIVGGNADWRTRHAPFTIIQHNRVTEGVDIYFSGSFVQLVANRDVDSGLSKHFGAQFFLVGMGTTVDTGDDSQFSIQAYGSPLGAGTARRVKDRRELDGHMFEVGAVAQHDIDRDEEDFISIYGGVTATFIYNKFGEKIVKFEHADAAGAPELGEEFILPGTPINYNREQFYNIAAGGGARMKFYCVPDKENASRSFNSYLHLKVSWQRSFFRFAGEGVEIGRGNPNGGAKNSVKNSLEAYCGVEFSWGESERAPRSQW